MLFTNTLGSPPNSVKWITSWFTYWSYERTRSYQPTAVGGVRNALIISPVHTSVSTPARATFLGRWGSRKIATRLATTAPFHAEKPNIAAMAAPTAALTSKATNTVVATVRNCNVLNFICLFICCLIWCLMLFTEPFSLPVSGSRCRTLPCKGAYTRLGCPCAACSLCRLAPPRAWQRSPAQAGLVARPWWCLSRR